ncbi:hypothetical protein ABZX93_09480 [Streptomyces sp. NPDC006632]|uniref:hypothetical protein n=1 Tax=unclassified Streptomyces TaxID=2593676 RepID=UPI002E1D189B
MAVEFTYEAPDISEEGDSVSWRWQVVNNLPEKASKVVLTHKLSPALPITHVSGPSAITESTVTSRWETLAAGEKAQGEITATLPEDLAGSVSISGRITWKNT